MGELRAAVAGMRWILRKVVLLLGVPAGKVPMKSEIFLSGPPKNGSGLRIAARGPYSNLTKDVSKRFWISLEIRGPRAGQWTGSVPTENVTDRHTQVGFLNCPAETIGVKPPLRFRLTA